MASPPIYSRQPPDGHEFPDYEERQHHATTEMQSSNDHDVVDNRNMDMVTNEDTSVTEASIKDDLLEYSTTPSTLRTSVPNFVTQAEVEIRSAEAPASSFTERSSLDVNLFSKNKQLKPIDLSANSRMLHTRSQSLVDISKPDRWTQINEHRLRGLSKLKGLVIPENVPIEPNQTPAHVHDLPEITSSTKMPKLPDYQPPSHVTSPVIKPVPSQRASVNLPSPIWKQQEANVASGLPKYSPAFKRRSLQLYSNAQLNRRSTPSTAAPAVHRFSTDFLYTGIDLETQQTPITSSSEDGVLSERSSLPSLNDSDNDSAFKSCESLHSLDYPNTTHKEIESANKRNLYLPPTSHCIPATSALIYQRKMFEQHSSPDRGKLVKPSRVNSNAPPSNLDKFKQQVVAPNGNASKSETSSKLDSNSAASPNRTVPKIMQKKPTPSVNDLRKKFQTPDPVPFVNMNKIKSTSTETGPPSKRPPMVPQTPPNVAKQQQATSAASEQMKIDPTEPEVQSAIAVIVSEFDSLPIEDCFVAKLKPLTPGGSLGLTLAGGIDYDSKDITVYSIRPGSVASNETTLKKGDQILSINGKVMKNLTHADTIAFLKESKLEIEIVYYSKNESISAVGVTPTKDSRSFELPPTEKVVEASIKVAIEPKPNSSIDITILKTSAGLGFSIAGGVDSPSGDLPLIVKKVFFAGAAEKSGLLRADDELLMIGDVDVTAMSRLDVWIMMKKLPEGAVNVTVRR